jgi:hypothetical protein
VVNDRHDLARIFWTGCLPQRRKLAAAIGVSGFVESTLPLDVKQSVKIGSYVVRRGVDQMPKDAEEDADVNEMLAPAITWKGRVDPLTASQAMTELSSLEATGYHCNFPAPMNDPTTDRYGVTMFLRNGTQPDKVLALYGPAGGDQYAPSNLIEYRDPTANELKACTNYENQKRKPPIPPRVALAGN